MPINEALQRAMDWLAASPQPDDRQAFLTLRSLLDELTATAIAANDEGWFEQSLAVPTPAPPGSAD